MEINSLDYLSKDEIDITSPNENPNYDNYSDDEKYLRRERYLNKLADNYYGSRTDGEY